MLALNERIRNESAFVSEMLEQIENVIVGQKQVIERLLIALLCQGHVLIEGVPGLAKTLAVKSLSDTIQTRFQRIQFTPDLLPADLIGTLVYDQKEGTFKARKGPIFANLILADEINRAPAKVQSALLEAMQERQVTIGDRTFPLEEPFLVMATQNPIEQEGTYPLPEAQVDRFMLKVVIDYPNRDEELEILRRMTKGEIPSAKPVTNPERILKARKTIFEIYVDEKIENYVVDIVMATRKPSLFGLEELDSLIEYGASPRASIYLTLASKALAFLRGRGYVTPEDVRAIGMDVLRHRIIPSYEAEAENVSPEDIITKIFDTVEVP
ncbi:MAG TPA: MoxR family ATPase [Firmicutes bacterium]|nr:MoxR family ATPase [Bacillota bacterium]